MKRYLAILLILAILSVPVMAMILEEPKELETIKPIGKDLYQKASFSYAPKQVTIIDEIIDIGLEIIGIEELIKEVEVRDTIDVVINGVPVANIPKGSKFEGMDIHEVCLVWQYGTDAWYGCEVSL